jgi:precorrin-6B C5,15-methyltransferase / cobalt-precorrin-6B C5,C15-methyltransferase
MTMTPTEIHEPPVPPLLHPPLGEDTCYEGQRFSGLRCQIIGVLDDGADSLSAAALAHLRAADCVIGGARTLALLAEQMAPGARRLDLGGALARVPEWVREA